jgi:DNA-binding NarL/FixJ family response regulator
MVVRPRVDDGLARKPRIIVASQDPLLRRGLRSVFNEHDAATVVADVCTEREALEATIRMRPDVLLLGLSTAPAAALWILPSVARLSRVLVLTHAGAVDSARQAMRFGAAGCLVHGEFTVPDLISAVSGTASVSRIIQAGRQFECGGVHGQLSRREAEVMDWVAQGMGNREIARRLVLSEKTVKNHITRIFAKLDVRSRSQAIVLWLRRDSPAVAE